MLIFMCLTKHELQLLTELGYAVRSNGPLAQVLIKQKRESVNQVLTSYDGIGRH